MLLRNSFRTKRNPICGELFKTSSLQNHKRTHTKRKFSKFLPDRFLTWKFILQFFSQIKFWPCLLYSNRPHPLPYFQSTNSNTNLRENSAKAHEKSHEKNFNQLDQVCPVVWTIHSHLDNPKAIWVQRRRRRRRRREDATTWSPMGHHPKGLHVKSLQPSTWLLEQGSIPRPDDIKITGSKQKKNIVYLFWFDCHLINPK